MSSRPLDGLWVMTSTYGVRLAVRDRRRLFALGLLCMAFFVEVLSSTSVFTAAPSMAADLGLSPAGAQWTFTACTLPGGALLLLGGRLADGFGARRVFVCGLALLVVASLVCGLAPTPAVLISARVGQGVSAALLMPAALSLVVSTFDDESERNKALAAWSAVGGMGATGGLLLGGVVTQALGWPWVFLVNVPVGLVMLALCPVLLVSARPVAGRVRLDVPGAMLVTVALGLIVYGTSRVPDDGWLRPGASGCVVAGLVLLIVFVMVEARTRMPLLPLRLFRSRSVVGGNLVLVAAGMSVDGLLFTMTNETQGTLGYSAWRFGLLTSVMTVSSVGAAYLAQRGVALRGVRVVAAVGTTMLGLTCLTMAWSTYVARPGWLLLLGMLLFGLGMGGAYVAGSIASLADVGDADTGIAAGLQNVSFTIGTTLGVALLSTVAATRATTAQVAPMAGYRAAFVAGVAIALAGTAATRVLRRTRAR